MPISWMPKRDILLRQLWDVEKDSYDDNAWWKPPRDAGQFAPFDIMPPEEQAQPNQNDVSWVRDRFIQEAEAKRKETQKGFYSPLKQPAGPPTPEQALQASALPFQVIGATLTAPFREGGVPQTAPNLDKALQSILGGESFSKYIDWQDPRIYPWQDVLADAYRIKRKAQGADDAQVDAELDAGVRDLILEEGKKTPILGQGIGVKDIVENAPDIGLALANVGIKAAPILAKGLKQVVEEVRPLARELATSEAGFAKIPGKAPKAGPIRISEDAYKKGNLTFYREQAGAKQSIMARDAEGNIVGDDIVLFRSDSPVIEIMNASSVSEYTQDAMDIIRQISKETGKVIVNGQTRGTNQYKLIDKLINSQRTPKIEPSAPKVEQPLNMPPKAPPEPLVEGAGMKPPRKPIWAGKTDMGGELSQDPYQMLVNSLEEQKTPIRDRVTQAKDKFMRQFYDRNRPLKELENETGIPAHKLAQVVPGSTAAGENSLRQFYRPVIASVGKDVKYLEQYMVGMRNADIVARNPQTLLPGGLTGGGNIKALETLERNLGPERFAKVSQAAQELWRLNDEQVLKPLLDNGLIDKKLYTEIKSANPHYVPFQRQDFLSKIENHFVRPEANVSETGLKKLSIEGSERPLDNPLARLEAGVIRTKQVIARNKAAKGIVDALKEAERNTGQKLVNVSGKAEHSNIVDTISYFDNGKKVIAEVPAIYAQVAKGMEWESNNILTNVLGKLSAPLRHGAVTYNPAFLVVNPLRDATTAFFRERLIPLSPEFWRGWVAVVKKDALFNEAANAGVLMSGIVDTMKSTNALARVNRLGAITVKSPKDALLVLPRLVEKANIIAEQGTRVSTFAKLRAQGIDTLEAAVRARDVTVDFSKSGTAMKVINQIVPFSNAGVQGSANVLRVIKNNPKWAALATAPFAMATVLSRVNNMRYDSSRLIPDYEYTNNWVVQIGEFTKSDGTLAPLYIKIPKGQIGAMLSFPGEALFNYARSDNDRSVVENILSAGLEAGKSLSPVSTDVSGVMPPVLGTAVGVQTNVDPFTGQNIVPYWEEKNTPTKEQYGPDTSQTAVAIGQQFNVSPRLVQYAIEDYTAGTGQLGLWLLDLGLGAVGYNPQKAKGQTATTPTEGLINAPVTKRFIGGKNTRPYYLNQEQPGSLPPLKGYKSRLPAYKPF